MKEKTSNRDSNKEEGASRVKQFEDLPTFDLVQGGAKAVLESYSQEMRLSIKN